jgi:Flp pilus assembly protein TadD
LNLAPTASAEEIKKAIHRELRVWSNRTNAPQLERRQEAERMVKTLEEAETTLLNPSKRAEYDRKLRSAPTEERQMDDADLSGTEDLVQEGWRLLIAGNIPDALYVATRATERQANNSEAWALLAQAKFRWGEIEDAIYEYKRAIKLRPNEASYYFDLGTVYESTERWNDALQQYQRASEVDPSSTMYRAAVGILFVKNERFQEGIDLLEPCVQKEPDNQTYQWFLAVAYHDYAMNDWWRDPKDGSLLCTSKKQVDHAKKYIALASQLRFEDQELKKAIAEMAQLADSMEQRKFCGNWFMVIFLGFFYVVPGYLWWYVNRRPVYLINRDYVVEVETGKNLSAGAKMGGLMGRIYSFFEATGEWGWLFGLAFMFTFGIILSPVFMWMAYKENYLDPKRA